MREVINVILLILLIVGGPIALLWCVYFEDAEELMMKQENSTCKKKKLDKIEAMLVISNAQKQTQKNFKRRELRFYWCEKCQAYHTTKQKNEK